MKKRSLWVLALLMLALVIVPATSLASNYMYVKTSGHGNVNMRSGPGTDYSVVCHVPHGSKVTVDSGFVGNNSWTSVSYNGHTGFIASRYLSSTKPSSGGSSGSSGSSSDNTNAMFNNFKEVNAYAWVTPTTAGNFVNLRWAPSKTSPVQAKYYSGQQLLVLKENSAWCQVFDAENNRSGFMLKSLLGR